MSERCQCGLTIVWQARSVGIVTDVGGLRIGLNEDTADVDLLRHREPSAAEIPGLLAAGYLIRPSEVTWVAPTCASADEFLSRLSGKDRQNIRTAQRSIAASRVRIAVDTLHEQLLNDFLTLYAQALEDMTNAIPVAIKQRDALLSDADAYFAVTVREAGRLVAACLAVRDADRDLVRIRFSAAEAHLRGASVTRVLYLAAIGEARNRGVGQVSLGTDLNLYGHIVQPGLFSFKSRLGFSAYPAPAVLDHGYDLAERVLSLSRLSEPTLTLGYATNADRQGIDRSAPLHLHVFTGKAGPDLRPYRAPFVGGVTVHQMPARTAEAQSQHATGSI
jgi:hypothetical protein